MLLGLVESGLSREDAYALVQGAAMRVWSEGGELRDLLAADPRVTERLDPAALDALFDPGWYVRHVPEVMDRVAAL